MEAGQISKWNVKTGDRFSAGDVLLTIETDKAEVDVEAQDDGYMGSQLFGPGTNTTTKTINVGEVIAILGEQEEDIKATDVPSEWNSQNSSTSSDHNSASAQEGQDHSPGSTVQSQTSTANPPGQVLKTLLPLSPAVSRILHELYVLLMITSPHIKMTSQLM
jgi:pyruvate/2-oxoglutarate dehydrogenase complex dihydrolipoamide acyltransferase (E2) component